ncbi:MAG: hypothetical protein OEW12_01110 [Deltaproteobacteria bacterium]|nr:hypothetical protein [Deltaproteobacteria bacterium]
MPLAPRKPLTDFFLRGAWVGILWGWATLGINALTGAFVTEHPLASNLVMFGAGGLLTGMFVAGLMGLLGERRVYGSLWLTALALSAGTWLALRLAGVALTFSDPRRYHPDGPQSAQGLALALGLGVMLAAATRFFPPCKRY